MASSRISYIDFLKALGVLLVILAHVRIPTPILFIRCFDVPLLVLISGFLANKSFEKDPVYDGFSFRKYFIKRFKRLVLPTWIMLAFLFSFEAASGIVHSAEYYIASFLLTRYGIGFVWIVLIYLYSALMAPFIKRFLSFRYYWFAFALLYCLYETAYFFRVGTNNIFILNTIYYLIPYGLLTSLGLNYSSMTKRAKLTVCITSFIIFVVCAAYYYFTLGGLQLPTKVKYPPRLFFLSYSIAVSFLLFMLCEGRENRVFRSRPIRFISSHSLWIYLWHIFYLVVSNKAPFTDNWILRYSLVILLSLITVWFQNFILDKFEIIFKRTAPKYLRG